MTKLLILYGTTDGHTAKIASYLASQRHGFGATVDVVEAGMADPDPRNYVGVIVAASVHAGGYQRAVVRWARAHAAALQGKPAAFLSVCLGVLQPDLEVQRDLIAITNRFEARTGWKPLRVKLVAGALSYTRYGWLKRMVMRRMAAKAGGRPTYLAITSTPIGPTCENSRMHSARCAGLPIALAGGSAAGRLRQPVRL